MNFMITIVLLLTEALTLVSPQICRNIDRSNVKVIRTAPSQHIQKRKEGSSIYMSCDWTAPLPPDDICNNFLLAQVQYAFEAKRENMWGYEGPRGKTNNAETYGGKERLKGNGSYHDNNTYGHMEFTLSDLRQSDTGMYFCVYTISGLNVDQSISLSVDVDECAAKTDDCEQGCTNLPFSFDFDATTPPTTTTTTTTTTTITTPNITTPTTTTPPPTFKPSYKCTCQDGYTLNSDGRTCNDVDECAAKTDDCEQGCINHKPFYKCTCQDGYTVNSDGRTCTNETKSPTPNTDPTPNTSRNLTDSAWALIMYMTSLVTGYVAIFVTSLKP